MRTTEQDKLNNQIQFLKADNDLKEYLISNKLKEIKKYRQIVMTNQSNIVKLQLQLKNL